MYIGNSRMLLGKNTNEKTIGEWLAVAPSSASSGAYGITGSGSGYCSEIFNGYLYVGGDFGDMVNGSTTTSVNNLIKYNLSDPENAVWESAVNTNKGSIQSLREIASGDHLLVAAADELFYITQTNSLTANSVSGGEAPYSGLSNTFDNVNISGTTYSATNSSKLCVANRVFDPYQIYNGGSKSIIFTSSSFLNPTSADSNYVNTGTGKILTILRERNSTRKSILARQAGYVSYTDTNEPNTQTTLDSDYHNMCFSNPTVFSNKIFVAAADFNKISVFNYLTERWLNKIDIPASLGNITTLNQVLYKNINFLIVGGNTGIFLVNPSDTNVTKDIDMPTTNPPRINSISVGSDSTIYVTGSFQFTDKNGVTAKNVAKFVPDASKLP